MSCRCRCFRQLKGRTQEEIEVHHCHFEAACRRSYSVLEWDAESAYHQEQLAYYLAQMRDMNASMRSKCCSI